MTSLAPPPPAPPSPPPPAPARDDQTWAPYVVAALVALLIAAAFLFDGLTPAERGPDRDRHGRFEASGLVDLEADTAYGVYDRTAGTGPRNLRVDFDGAAVAVGVVRRVQNGEPEQAGRFTTSSAGTYRVRVDGQSPLNTVDPELEVIPAFRAAGFSVGDDPFTSRKTLEAWPLFGAGLAAVGTLFFWGIGYDNTRSRDSPRRS